MSIYEQSLCQRRWKDMSKTIGSRIKEAREALRISQAALAKHINVDQSTVALWETDRTGPRRAKMEKLAEALFVTPEFLQFGEKKTGEPNGDIPVVGYARGDGSVSLVKKKTMRYFPAPPDDGNDHPRASECIMVDGDGLWPYYRDGDVIFISAPRKMQSMIGVDAVLKARDDTMLIGTIASIKKRSFCSVTRLNGPAIPEIDIETAQAILWVRKALTKN